MILNLKVAYTYL